ncbi:MAG: hypothetical protein K9I94_03535 [Bacteroidales bacterium]|nr:hypothetical protein [Bacteroidales bacterium]
MKYNETNTHLDAAKLVRCVFIIPIFIISLSLPSIYGQNLNLGLSTGMMSEAKLFEKPMDPNYAFGLLAAYQPSKAQFSLTAEPTFFSHFDAMMIPVSATIKPGNKVKLRLSAGLLPFIRFNPEAPDKTIELGHKLSAGLDVRISPQLRIFGEIGDYTIPNLEYHYSHFGLRDIFKNPINLIFYRIGIYRELGLFVDEQ